MKIDDTTLLSMSSDNGFQQVSAADTEFHLIKPVTFTYRNFLENEPDESVLFIGGGRRVQLGKKFIEKNYLVNSYELDRNVPISYCGRVYRGVKWDNKGIITDIEKAIHEFNPRLIIPLQDKATVICAEIREKYPIVTSSVVANSLCFNKKSFELYMETNFPKIYPSPELHRPYILKGIDGFGSRDLFYPDSTYFSGDTFDADSFVAQRLVKGTEYSVDCYFSKWHGWIGSIPRKRLRVDGGEVVSSIVDMRDDLINLSKDVGKGLKIEGPCNMQFIVDRFERPWIIEVNARFGGGYTFSMSAGLRAIDYIENDYIHGGEGNYIFFPINGLKLERSYRDHYFSP